MKPFELNQLAIWLPMNTKELSVKAFNAGYAYKQKQGEIILRSDLTNPIYRYAKNYKKGKIKYSLCIISHENNTKKIEKWLDTQAKTLETKDIEPKFKLLKVFYECGAG